MTQSSQAGAGGRHRSDPRPSQEEAHSDEANRQAEEERRNEAWRKATEAARRLEETVQRVETERRPQAEQPAVAERRVGTGPWAEAAEPRPAEEPNIRRSEFLMSVRESLSGEPSRHLEEARWWAQAEGFAKAVWQAQVERRAEEARHLAEEARRQAAEAERDAQAELQSMGSYFYEVLGVSEDA